MISNQLRVAYYGPVMGINGAIPRTLPAPGPDLFAEAMATEFEVDFDHTHTLVLEAEKPAA